MSIQAKILLLQCQMLMAEMALKEYNAPWLTNVKKVVRDGSGRFASTASKVAKDVETTGKTLGQELQITGEIVQELLRNTEFRKRAGLAAGLPAAKVIQKVANAVKLDPEIARKIDNLVSDLQRELIKTYGQDRSPFSQALRKSDEVKPPANATYAQKMEFQVAKYRALEEAIKTPERFERPSQKEPIAEEESAMGNLVKYGIPIAASFAIALAPELLLPLILEGTVDLGAALGSAVLGTGIDAGVNTALDKAEVDDPVVRVVAGLFSGAAAAGVLTGAKGVVKRKAEQKALEIAKREVALRKNIELAEKIKLEASAHKQAGIHPSLIVANDRYLIFARRLEKIEGDAVPEKEEAENRLAKALQDYLQKYNEFYHEYAGFYQKNATEELKKMAEEAANNDPEVIAWQREYEKLSEELHSVIHGKDTPEYEYWEASQKLEKAYLKHANRSDEVYAWYLRRKQNTPEISPEVNAHAMAHIETKKVVSIEEYQDAEAAYQAAYQERERLKVLLNATITKEAKKLYDQVAAENYDAIYTEMSEQFYPREAKEKAEKAVLKLARDLINDDNPAVKKIIEQLNKAKNDYGLKAEAFFDLQNRYDKTFEIKLKEMGFLPPEPPKLDSNF